MKNMKTTIKKIGFFIIFIILVNLAQAQSSSSCPNFDFSQGNFTDWVCKISTSQGRPSTAYTDLIWTGSNPVITRHTVMTNIYGYDANTCNGALNSQLPLIPNGFNQSARIGNDYTMFEADAIAYQMTVDTNNALLLLHFAVVFQDPNHSPAQQPYFEIRVQDSSGNLLNIPCNRYTVTCGSGIPGFQDCGSDVHWRDWTTVGVNLFSLIGKTVYIVIASADCGQGGHYGYGYFVGECRSMKISGQYCKKSSVARLVAPEGFVSYVWRGPNGGVVGTNQTLVLQNPIDSSQYVVTLTSAIGCSSSLTYTISANEIFADFICDSNTYQCYPSGVILNAKASSTKSKIYYHEWSISKLYGNVGIEYFTNDSNFNYFFKDTGYYKISLTVFSEDGCSDTSSVMVYSYPKIDVNISAPSIICKNEETEIIASGADVYAWKNVKRVQSDSSAIIDKGGMYIVKGFNSIGCGYDTVVVHDISFDIQYTIKNNRCAGEDSGKIKITGVLGDYIPPVYHYWKDLGYTNGAPLSERKNLSAGKYIVYSQDNFGCSRYDTIEITESPTLGSIGQIIGDTLVTPITNSTYSVSVVEGITLYHWFADEILQGGNVQIFDSITFSPSIEIPIKNNNPIQLQVYAFNSCDTTDTASILINSKTGVSDVIADKSIDIYPNPATDQITIKSKNNKIEEIKIYDIVGKEVKAQTANSIESILNLGDLHNGLYFVCVKTEKGIITTKILKK